MGKTKIVVHRKGVLEVMKAPGVLADLDRRARRVAEAAGPGMEASSMIGRNRARASVITATREARKAEAERLALTRALDAGR